MTGLDQAVMVGTNLSLDDQLERNVALTTPQDTARGMFFNGALAAVSRLAGEEVAALCRAATGERKHTDFFNYPVSSFLKMCLVMNRHLGARLGGCHEVLRWLGEQSAKDFLSSMVGKTALLLSGNNPKRFFTQLPSSYRAAVSYGERSVMWLGEKHGRIVMRHDFLPFAYHEGVLIGALRAMEVHSIQVIGRSIGRLDSDYELLWE